MDAILHHLIEALHRTPHRCVLALTGGGTSAAAMLLNVPGGSRTVLEVHVPYHEQALIEFLGCRPEHFCSAATARAMAVRAYERAGWLVPSEPVVGVGCTASLATDRPKRGDHRFHVAVKNAGGMKTYSLTLTKDARDRAGEETVLDVVLLNALAEAFGLPERLIPSLLTGEEIGIDLEPALDPLEVLLQGGGAALCVEADGRWSFQTPRPALLMPGAFNPIHHGHRGMATAAARLTGLSPAFELSVLNVDKPPLTAEAIRQRLHQFAWDVPLWLTRAPTFAEKASLFPGTIFVVGADTAARIVSPRYYDHNEEQMAKALNHLCGQGCRFLVAGRVDASGRFLCLGDLPIPPVFRELFAEIPEGEFRLDVASSSIRSSSISSPFTR